MTEGRRRIGRTVLLSAAGLLALFGAVSVISLFSTVTHNDGVARLRLIDPGGQIVKASPTDLYAIEVRRHSISGPLCPSAAGLQAERVTENYEFRNILAEYVPLVFALHGGIFGEEGEDIQSKLTWNVDVSYLPISEVKTTVTSYLSGNPACQETVESHLRRGDHVCAVQKVFAKLDTHSTFAVAFEERCIVPCREGEECDDTMTTPVSDRLPFIVKMKNWIGLIDYHKS